MYTKVFFSINVDFFAHFWNYLICTLIYYSDQLWMGACDPRVCAMYYCWVGGFALTPDTSLSVTALLVQLSVEPCL